MAFGSHCVFGLGYRQHDVDIADAQAPAAIASGRVRVHAAAMLSNPQGISRGVAALLALSPLAALAASTTDANPPTDHWEPISSSARSITGRITLTPGQITFQNGMFLLLAPASQMIFRPERKQKVTAELYKVTQPADPALENGNRLCGGKGVAFILIWKSQRTGKDTEPRTVNIFSGGKLISGSSDDCGRFVYDAGTR